MAGWIRVSLCVCVWKLRFYNCWGRGPLVIDETALELSFLLIPLFSLNIINEWEHFWRVLHITRSTSDVADKALDVKAITINWSIDLNYSHIRHGLKQCNIARLIQEGRTWMKNKEYSRIELLVMINIMKWSVFVMGEFSQFKQNISSS